MKKAILAIMALFVLPALAANQWIGSYEFFEHAEPNQNWTYTLKVADSGTTLAVEGFQTYLRYRCTAKVQGSSLVVAYDAAGAENVGKTYPKGTVLFTLKQGGNGLTTEWGALKPNLADSASRPVAFEKK